MATLAPGRPTSPRQLLCDGASLLNGLAMLIFAGSPSRCVPAASPLRSPLRALSVGLAISVALRLVAAGYMSLFLLTGREAAPPTIVPLFARLAFLFTQGTALWFLLQFRRQSGFADMLERCSGP